MAEIITARLSEEVTAPELSRMWESQRIETPLPEIVFEARGPEISLRFHAAKAEPGFPRLKAIFERTLRRNRPQVRVEWLEPAPAR